MAILAQVVQDQRLLGKFVCVAMARNINVELLSDKVYTLAVRPDD